MLTIASQMIWKVRSFASEIIVAKLCRALAGVKNSDVLTAGAYPVNCCAMESLNVRMDLMNHTRMHVVQASRTSARALSKKTRVR